MPDAHPIAHDHREIPVLALSIADSRKALGDISRTKLHELIQDGEIESFKIGSRRMISPSSLAAYVRRRVEETCAAQGISVTPSPTVTDVVSAVLASAPTSDAREVAA